MFTRQTVANKIAAYLDGEKRGDVGTVVEVFESNEHHPAGCIVEFLDEMGEVLALLDVTNSSEIVPLNLKLRAA
jgi:hypothetical protein